MKIRKKEIYRVYRRIGSIIYWKHTRREIQSNHIVIWINIVIETRRWSGSETMKLSGIDPYPLSSISRVVGTSIFLCPYLLF